MTQYEMICKLRNIQEKRTKKPLLRPLAMLAVKNKFFLAQKKRHQLHGINHGNLSIIMLNKFFLRKRQKILKNATEVQLTLKGK